MKKRDVREIESNLEYYFEEFLNVVFGFLLVMISMFSYGISFMAFVNNSNTFNLIFMLSQILFVLTTFYFVRSVRKITRKRYERFLNKK